jgi:hypothetical protein
MNRTMLKELLLESLEYKRGGVKVYGAALECAANDELRDKWIGYYEQTRQHVQIMERVCRKLEIDPDQETPGRQAVHDLSVSLVSAAEAARAAGDAAGVQVVACQCVLAETKHADWELIGTCAKALDGMERKALLDAYDEVDEDEEEDDEPSLPRGGPWFSPERRGHRDSDRSGSNR